jgi:hypothetical protein
MGTSQGRGAGPEGDAGRELSSSRKTTRQPWARPYHGAGHGYPKQAKGRRRESRALGSSTMSRREALAEDGPCEKASRRERKARGFPSQRRDDWRRRRDDVLCVVEQHARLAQHHTDHLVDTGRTTTDEFTAARLWRCGAPPPFRGTSQDTCRARRALVAARQLQSDVVRRAPVADSKRCSRCRARRPAQRNY